MPFFPKIRKFRSAVVATFHRQSNGAKDGKNNSAEGFGGPNLLYVSPVVKPSFSWIARLKKLVKLPSHLPHYFQSFRWYPGEEITDLKYPRNNRDIVYQLTIEYDEVEKKLVVHGLWLCLYDRQNKKLASRLYSLYSQKEKEQGLQLMEVSLNNSEVATRDCIDKIWYSQAKGNMSTEDFRAHELVKHSRCESTDDFNAGYLHDLLKALSNSEFKKVEDNILGKCYLGEMRSVSLLEDQLAVEIGVRVKLLLDPDTNRKFKGFGVLFESDCKTKIDHPHGRLYQIKRPFDVEVKY